MSQVTASQVTLSVPDISCGHCQQTVNGALTSVAGVKSVAVDIASRQVQVEYDPAQVDVDRMSAILAEADYPVAAATAAPESQKSVVPVAGCSCCSPSQ